MLDYFSRQQAGRCGCIDAVGNIDQIFGRIYAAVLLSCTMSIQLKSADEIAKLREANLVVSEVLDTLEAASKPGVTTWELNEIAAAKLKQLKAESAFLGYPRLSGGALHVGERGRRPRHPAQGRRAQGRRHPLHRLRCLQGRLVRRLGADHPHRDDLAKEAQALIDATRESLERAIAQCVPGNRLGDIGWAVQSHVEPQGYSVVRQFVGHGIGRAMHEEPHVPNYGDAGQGPAAVGRPGRRHRADGQRRHSGSGPSKMTGGRL